MSKAKSEGKGVETQDGPFITTLAAVYWASIVRVDGWDVGGRSTVEVLPGYHEVELAWRQHVPGDMSVRLTVVGPTLWSSEAEGRTVVTANVGAGKDYRLVWDRAPAVRVGDTWETIPDGMVAHFEEREAPAKQRP